MIENATYAYLDAFVDELLRHGVNQAVVCPGSRSTPLAIALARRPEEMRIWLELDERSAGFFALGMARALKQPVMLICTSGTAVANFMPAVVEAHLSRIPLLVLTADRPPELRDNGAPQAIDQIKIFGNYVKWFSEVALPEASNEMLRYVRTLAGRAATTANTVPSGPVHLNFPFREPLVPIEGELPPVAKRDKMAWQGRENNQAYVEAVAPLRAVPARQLAEVVVMLTSAERGLIVVGPQADLNLASAVNKLSQVTGYPILADPLSQVRSQRIINNYDAFLRLPRFRDNLQPDLILRFGAAPTSKPLNQYLEHYPDAPMLIVDEAEDWREPSLRAEKFIWSDPLVFCDIVTALIKSNPDMMINPEWEEQWQEVSQLTAEVINAKFADNDELFEGQVFAELNALLPENSTLFVGNSMPVRDLDTFFNGDHTAQILCNRGANGIDGVVSSALGTAAALDVQGVDTVTTPLVLVIGDISFYHDMNGLLAAKMHKLNATIILLNNDGGGIFSFLAQSNYPQYFEQLFGTPHGLNFAPAAQMYGADYTQVENWADFRAACQKAFQQPGLKIIEVPTNRERNVILHRQLWDALDKS